jgi:MFS family permease
VTDRGWRGIIVPAYGPTMLVSIGHGAMLPLVALSARELGASVAVAAFVVSLVGIGQLIGDLPAGALAARIGEQRALVLACLLEAGALIGAWQARSLVMLAVCVLLVGTSSSVFNLARLAYLAEAIPFRLRARALSTLGGTLRFGLFVGPFIGAALVSRWYIGTAYAFAAGMTLVAAAVTALLPDLTRDRRAAVVRHGHRHRSVLTVLAAHRRVLSTLGVGVLMISAARATRQSIIPLWADAQGVDAATISVIFGLSAGVDMLLFYPGGAIMDRYGRAFVAVPAMIVLGTGFALLPLAHDVVGIAAIAGLMGLGNGISAGIVMTLGADAAPRNERAQFLSGWRLASDVGHAGGPLVITAVSAVASLAAAAVVMGVITWAGAGWLARWVPAYAVRTSRSL